MPTTISWSAQNSNVYRAYGIMSSHNRRYSYYKLSFSFKLPFDINIGVIVAQQVKFSSRGES